MSGSKHFLEHKRQTLGQHLKFQHAHTQGKICDLLLILQQNMTFFAKISILNILYKILLSSEKF